MPKKTPKLNAPATVGVNESFKVTGSNFPKNTAVLVVVDQTAPDFGREPTKAAETDRAGEFEVTTAFNGPGTFEIHPCIHSNKKGGSWDCRSVEPITVVAS